MSLLPGAKRKMITHGHHELFQRPRKKILAKNNVYSLFFLFVCFPQQLCGLVNQEYSKSG